MAINPGVSGEQRGVICFGGVVVLVASYPVDAPASSSTQIPDIGLTSWANMRAARGRAFSHPAWAWVGGPPLLE